MLGTNSRKDYLKRYCDAPNSEIKKRVKPKNAGKETRFKIVDEDLDLKKIEIGIKDDDEVGDEAPLVVEVVDERPEHVKISEIYSSSRWKKMGSAASDETSNVSLCKDSESSSRFRNVSGHLKKSTDSDADLSPPGRTGSVQKLSGNSSLSNVRHDSDSDISPPREKNRLSATDLSVKKKSESESHGRKYNSEKNKSSSLSHRPDRNVSPPRRQYVKNFGNSSLSRNNVQHDSDSDFSPPRQLNSTKQKSRHDSSSDSSSSRLRMQDFSEQRTTSQHKHAGLSEYKGKFNSPLQKSLQHNSDSDISPPRQQAPILSSTYNAFPGKQCSSDSDDSLKHERKHHDKRKSRHDSGSDGNPSTNDVRLSRRKTFSPHRNNSDSDFSPPRQSVSGKHISQGGQCDLDDSVKSRNLEKHIQLHHSEKRPPEKRSSSKINRRHDSSCDNSPPRGHLQGSSKLRTVSHHKHYKSSSYREKSPHHRKDIHEVMDPKTLDLKNKRRTSTLSGMRAGLQNAATLHEEAQNFRKREQIAINALDDELSGRNAETIARDRCTGKKRNLKEEMLKKKEEEKKNDAKLEKYMEWGKGLKQKDDQQQRLMNDMYEMSKPLARYRDDEDLEKDLKSDLHVEDPMFEYMKKKRQKTQPNTPSFPIYSGPPAPPNRFNIAPGHRWDGVDRSNGFEKKFFEKINNTKATEQQAYMWSIENM